MKQFKGYYIIGASNREEAENEKGLLLWSQEKPNRLVRFLDRVLLKIYWVDKVKNLEERGKTAQSSNNSDVKIEMSKLVPKKKRDGRGSELKLPTE
jgi:hypothetical protein